MTFRGKPVLDSPAIGADFGSKAAGAFSEAITAIAAGRSIDLQDKGPIPDNSSKEFMADLKEIYKASTEEIAYQNVEKLQKKWESKYILAVRP